VLKSVTVTVPGTRLEGELVVARTPDKGIHAAAAQKTVVAASTAQAVRAGIADEQVIEGAAHHVVHPCIDGMRCPARRSAVGRLRREDGIEPVLAILA
jgi:hypothetical protein